MKNRLLIAGILVSFSIQAQKKIIDHTVYNDWKTLSSSKVSSDGRFISYEINPHRGDGYLYIYDTQDGSLDSIPRGKSATFSGNSTYLAFRIKPGYDTLRNCELEKVDKKKWPKDSLGIYLLKSDSLVKKPKIKSISLNDNSDWGVFMFDHNKLPSKKKKKKKWCKKKKETEYESDGKVIWVYHPDYQNKKIKDVRKYSLSENGTYLAYTTHQKIDCDSVKVHVLKDNQALKTKEEVFVRPASATAIDKLTFDDAEQKLVYLLSEDSTKVKNYSLELLDLGSQKTSTIADTTSSFIPEGDAVSINYQPKFTKNGALLYFGVAEKAMEEPKDTLTEKEKVKLDIWHYADKRLQPKQLLEKRRDEKKTDLFVYHFIDNKAIQLSNDTLRTSAETDLKGEYLLAFSREQYMAKDNWSMPWPSDYYRVSAKTGEADPLVLGTGFEVNLSPTGERMVMFNNSDKHFYSYRLENGVADEFCITCENGEAIWLRDINGQPRDATTYGVIGWDESEDKVYLQSRYDVWMYSFESGDLTSITEGIGRKSKIKIEAREWSRDSVYFHYDNVYFKGFDEKTKGTHLYKIDSDAGANNFVESGYFDANVYYMARSKNKKQYMLRKMTFNDYPELFAFNGSLEKLDQISVTNPQKEEYNWGKVDLINWKSYEGLELEGLLYKPEDFDPNKEYPLLVYFYELYSDRLHSHYIPKPTASIIYPTEYASAGYVVFMPDIRYTPGHPAKSAYDCIMSGTDKVLEMYPNIDSTRMGLQGQSWGGYQTAQLVTMTKRYSAAMAGAPVSNMFSAYGGIRWGSGLNRQFQYEKTQSRIGATIWEKPELYIENSPLFHVPNIETPLLIMHNDKDGAVPWYQGIEMFTAMKRLNKVAWLLNYNGDKHNLMENANRMDLSIRMRQFFDHYLQNEPAPSWMTDGLPATLKGKEMRYE
jgi:dipeptidyl aminopeptidase/acylaminoacyl peptidase